MDDEKPTYNPPRSVKRAMSHHGPDVVEDFYSHIPLTPVQLSIDLIPAVLAGGAAAGAFLTEGCLSWVLWAIASLLVWPSVIGLRGAASLIANRKIVVLVYKDRLLYQNGSDHQDVPWADIEEVFVSTQAGKFENGFLYESGNAQRIWIETEFPIAKYWLEWTEVRTRDGRVIRIPSSLPGYTDLSRDVQSRTSELLAPVALAAVTAGQPVQFGPLAVSLQGLSLGGDEVPWSEHHWTGYERGCVWTKLSDGSMGPEFKTGEVPNLVVALYLINQMKNRAEQSEE